MFDVFHQPVELQNPVMSEDVCEVACDQILWVALITTNNNSVDTRPILTICMDRLEIISMLFFHALDDALNSVG
jgi:hypothetical protein